jgi:prepilin-type N-terminal cleavage/methylation domain-containing protein
VRERSGAPFGVPLGTRGISLLEVIVALAILSVVLISLAGIMWQMGRHSRVSGVASARTAALESWASLAQAARWDSLNALVGCVADTTAGLAYTRCFEVSNLSSSLRQVRVIIAPTASAVLPPETLLVQRTRPRQRSPLNLPP